MSADDDLLAMLRAVPNLNVHDGAVPVDNEAKVILVPLPYVVYWSTTGYDRDVRKSGDVNGRVLEFQLTGVGETREQARAALDKARTAISRKRLNGNLIQRAPDNPLINKDDDLTRPGGAPVYYGVDRYAVAT